jgi:HSP20 family molecular chaperone IbpA
MMTSQLTNRRSFFNDFDSLFFNLPLDTVSTTNTYAARVENDVLEVAISVIGHDPKNVNVELTEDRIFVKAHRNEADKEIGNTLVKDIDDTFRVGKDFNGLSAKAKIDNGILRITVEKKEASKPKRLSISF